MVYYRSMHRVPESCQIPEICFAIHRFASGDDEPVETLLREQGDDIIADAHTECRHRMGPYASCTHSGCLFSYLFSGFPGDAATMAGIALSDEEFNDPVARAAFQELTGRLDRLQFWLRLLACQTVYQQYIAAGLSSEEASRRASLF